VAWPLKAGIVEPEDTSITRLRHSIYDVRVATVMHAAVIEELEAIFSVWSAQCLCDCAISLLQEKVLSVGSVRRLYVKNRNRIF
jgi:hypothetical protein